MPSVIEQPQARASPSVSANSGVPLTCITNSPTNHPLVSSVMPRLVKGGSMGNWGNNMGHELGSPVTYEVAQKALQKPVKVRTSDRYRSDLAKGSQKDPAAESLGRIIRLYFDDKAGPKCDVIWDNGKVLCGYSCGVFPDLCVAQQHCHKPTITESPFVSDVSCRSSMSGMPAEADAAVTNHGNGAALEAMVGYLGQAPTVRKVGSQINIWSPEGPLESQFFKGTPMCRSNTVTSQGSASTSFESNELHHEAVCQGEAFGTWGDFKSEQVVTSNSWEGLQMC